MVRRSFNGRNILSKLKWHVLSLSLAHDFRINMYMKLYLYLNIIASLYKFFCLLFVKLLIVYAVNGVIHFNFLTNLHFVFCIGCAASLTICRIRQFNKLCLITVSFDLRVLEFGLHPNSINVTKAAFSYTPSKFLPLAHQVCGFSDFSFRNTLAQIRKYLYRRHSSIVLWIFFCGSIY